MDKTELKHFLALLMCSDPWPITDKPDENSQAVMENFANEEAYRYGFTDWLDAYHKL